MIKHDSIRMCVVCVYVHVYVYVSCYVYVDVYGYVGVYVSQL